MDLALYFFSESERQIFLANSRLALATRLSRQAVTDAAAGCVEALNKLTTGLIKKKSHHENKKLPAILSFFNEKWIESVM